MNPIAEAWKGYRQDVVPKNASQVQVLECRRAFFAGARCLDVMHTVLASLPPADREVLRKAIATELATFAATVGTTLEGKV